MLNYVHFYVYVVSTTAKESFHEYVMFMILLHYNIPVIRITFHDISNASFILNMETI